jgi:hypothetical protein
MNSFIKDLNFGKKYELIFAKLTNKKFIQTVGLSSYDIELNYNNKIIKYEVKTDKKTYHTGNFAVEFMSNNKLSGISTSTANYWVFIEIIDYEEDNDDKNYDFYIYVIPIEKLKELIKINNFKVLSVCGNKNKVYLIPRRYISYYYVNYKNNREFFIDKMCKNDRNYSIEELETMINSL